MSTERIKSISEAFSMQPKLLNVSKESDWDFINDKPNACKEIKLENHGQYPDNELYYVGYNFEDQKIFKYRANTVNVHYFAP